MKTFLLATVALTAISMPAQAAVVAVTSAGALGQNDTISWAQLGSAFTTLSTPQAVTSDNGLTATLDDSSGATERRDQNNGWGGNFLNGATLLWNAGSGDLTITFATAIRGIGAQVQSDSYGAFTSTILVNGGALGSFSADGNSTAFGDNSAIFHGVLSDAADITSITFQNLPGASFAIGNLALNANAVPEPATWAMMIVGFGAVGAGMRRRNVRVSFA